MMLSFIIVFVLLTVCVCAVFFGVKRHNKHHTHYRQEHHHLFKHYKSHQQNEVEKLKAEEKELLDRLNSVQVRLAELGHGIQVVKVLENDPDFQKVK